MGVIYVIGGGDGGSNYFNTTEAYFPSNNSWNTLTPMPTSRYYLASCAINGVIYAIGGENGNGSLNTNEAYFPSNESWITLCPMPTRRSGKLIL